MSDQHVHTGCTHSDNIVLGGEGAEKDKEAEAEAADKAEATTTTISNWFRMDSTFYLFGVESIF